VVCIIIFQNKPRKCLRLPKSQKKKQQFTSPQIYLSSSKLYQGDTLLIKIPDGSFEDKIIGEFDSMKIDFFKLEAKDNWIGIVGIDVKKKPGKYNLFINSPNGEIFKKDIEVIERKFPITELLVTKELEEKGYTPAKIVENITTKENLTLKEILSIYTEKAYFNQTFVYPLKNIRVVGVYGNIRKSGDVGAQHLGVDLDAATGTPVYAVNDGVVRFSQELTTYGKTLIIDHGFGIFSLYLHLNEFKTLKGTQVKHGDIVGLSGNTGYSIEPHLHFSVKVNGASVDPLIFIETIDKEIVK